MLGGGPGGPIGAPSTFDQQRRPCNGLGWWTVERGDGLGKTLRRNAQVPIAGQGAAATEKEKSREFSEEAAQSTSPRLFSRCFDDMIAVDAVDAVYTRCFLARNHGWSDDEVERWNLEMEK
jgi:hypothetical protein